MSSGRTPLNKASAEKITKHLTEKSEWFGFAGQTFAIASSAVVDQVSPSGRLLLWALAAIHLGLAGWARRIKRGPFSIGPPWGAVWLSAALVMPVIVAVLVAPGEYGTSPVCVQMCAYPSAPLVVFAFYPWGVVGQGWRRPWVQVLTLAVIALEPLLIIYVANDGAISVTNWHAVVLSAFPNVLAFLAGVEVRRLCEQVAAEQFRILRPEYDHRYEKFHGPINTLMDTINNRLPADAPLEILDQLTTLDRLIKAEYRGLATLDEEVNVLRAIRRNIELVEPFVEVIRELPTGTDFVPQQVGQLIEDAVANLLGNALKHGAGPVAVAYQKENDVVFLVVSDHGPGIDPGTLDDESTYLDELRDRARQLGGDLTIDLAYRSGASVVLYLPTDDPR